MKSDRHIYILTFHEGYHLKGIKVYKSLRTAIKHGKIWEGNQLETNREVTIYERDPFLLIGASTETH